MDEVGGPEVLVARDAPDPVAGPGQAVVAVEWASITFVETQVRAGRGPFPIGALPRIPGNGVGGTVAAVGHDVDPHLVGTRVVTTTGGAGGYASAVAVDASLLVVVPDGVALDVATALLADGRTALLLHDTVAPRPGERVLVLAAGGGVGSLLVQLALAAGAEVVGAAGGATKVAAVQGLGATGVDYSVPGWAEAVGRVDAVLDGVGGDLGGAAIDLVAPGGRVLRYGMASGSFTAIDDDEAAARAVALLSTGPLPPEEASRLTARALALAAAGDLRPRIGQTFPLDRAADAHRAIEARRTIGKTLLSTA